MDEGALESLEAEQRVVPESDVKHLQAEVRELQRLLGKKTMEVEILKEAVELARPKKDCYCGRTCRQGRWGVKTVADAPHHATGESAARARGPADDQSQARVPRHA
jgi:hypothetical protein